MELSAKSCNRAGSRDGRTTGQPRQAADRLLVARFPRLGSATMAERCKGYSFIISDQADLVVTNSLPARFRWHSLIGADKLPLRAALGPRAGAWKPRNESWLGQVAPSCDRVADAYVQGHRLKAFAPVSLQVSNIRFQWPASPRTEVMPPAVLGRGYRGRGDERSDGHRNY